MDYNSRSYSLTFIAGINRFPFRIQINNDDTFEGNENFSVAIDLSSLPSYVMPTYPSKAIVVISDEDDGMCFISVMRYTCTYIMNIIFLRK